MASSAEFKEFIDQSLSLCENLSYKKMMGEYLVYSNGIYFGAICDDRFLVKIVAENEKYGFKKQLPYDGAKPMFAVDELDDKEFLARVVSDTIFELKRLEKTKNKTKK